MRIFAAFLGAQNATERRAMSVSSSACVSLNEIEIFSRARFRCSNVYFKQLAVTLPILEPRPVTQSFHYRSCNALELALDFCYVPGAGLDCGFEKPEIHMLRYRLCPCYHTSTRYLASFTYCAEKKRLKCMSCQRVSRLDLQEYSRFSHFFADDET